MGQRTPEERQLIDSLPVRQSGEMCNARTGKGEGYCKMPAGFGTDHVGTGRCKFHGGAGAGRPIIHGKYSQVLKSNLKERYDDLINDPRLIDLYAEMATMKTMMTVFMEEIQSELEEGGLKSDFWVQDVANKFGSKLEKSPKAMILLDMMETMRRLFKDITDAESKANNNLDIKQLHNVIRQIANIMNTRCSECPVRVAVAQDLAKIRLPKQS